MNRSGLIVGIFLILLPTILFSQNWQALNSGVSNHVLSLFADTSTNKLYIGREYTGSGTNCLDIWNGTSWDTMGNISWNIYSINKFQGNILVDNGNVLKWNGSNWNSLGIASNNAVLDLYNDRDEDLYATGWFDSIGGLPASKIAKWNGTNWSRIDSTNWIGGSINCAIIYQGKLYIGGNFWDNTGTISRIARWDSTHWQSIGTGINGSSFVSCFTIYNNELYVGGMFNASNGNPGTAIAKWDGNQWSDVGGGMSGTNAKVLAMKVYNGYLYAGGGFSAAGGVTANCLARWDGTNWCGLGYNGTGVSGGTLFGIEVLNNGLYIAGSFTAINGDTMNYVSKWIGGNYTDSCGNLASISDLSVENSNLSIYPNPATDQITLELHLIKTEDVSIEIKNILGQSLLTKDLQPSEEKATIDISNLPSGIYLVELRTAKERFSRKFVKQ